MTPGALAELVAPTMTGAQPDYQALSAALRGLVLDGRLVVGDRIPSERGLADALVVSRATVTAAYRSLRSQGYLDGVRGGGSRVTLRGAPVTRPDTGPRPGLAVDLDLTIAALPAPAALPDLIGRALEPARLSSYLSGPGLHPFGIEPLREAVARRLTLQGLPTRPEQVLVTQGALHGWDLLLRALAGPGSPVLVEQPTYPAVVDAARAHRCRVRALPVTADGWSLPRREAQPPVLAHVTPDFQNPTGYWAGTAARRELLAGLPAECLVVVDETFRELALDDVATRPRAMAALGGSSRVVTLGSLSKSVWAGLRIGWVRAAPALVARLAAARTAQDLGTPIVDQLIAAQVLEGLDGIVADRRVAMAAARDHLLDGIARRLPSWRARRPAGGLVLWAELPAGETATGLAAAALEAGLRVSPGPRFGLGGTLDRFLRLPFTAPLPELDDAVGRLASLRASRRSESLSVWTA